MDFWNWLWIIAFFVMMFGGWKLFTDMGQRALSRHLSEQTPLPVQVRKTPDTAQHDWQKQFDALVQATCTHEFDWRALRWWQCVLCNYQKPWGWEKGCLCIQQEEWVPGTTSTRKVLYHRHGNCPFHGRPNLRPAPKTPKL